MDKPRECITHHICDCKASALEAANKKIAELEAQNERLKRLHWANVEKLYGEIDRLEKLVEAKGDV